MLCLVYPHSPKWIHLLSPDHLKVGIPHGPKDKCISVSNFFEIAHFIVIRVTGRIIDLQVDLSKPLCSLSFRLIQPFGRGHKKTERFIFRLDELPCPETSRTTWRRGSGGFMSLKLSYLSERNDSIKARRQMARNTKMCAK